jgi:hypothetical protein
MLSRESRVSAGTLPILLPIVIDGGVSPLMLSVGRTPGYMDNPAP